MPGKALPVVLPEATAKDLLFALNLALGGGGAAPARPVYVRPKKRRA